MQNDGWHEIQPRHTHERLINDMRNDMIWYERRR